MFVDEVKVELTAGKGGNGIVAYRSELKIEKGAPYVEGATVTAKVEKNGKAKKIIIFKYRPKKKSRTKKGHRQAYTKLTIEAINA